MIFISIVSIILVKVIKINNQIDFIEKDIKQTEEGINNIYSKSDTIKNI